MNHLDLFSGIGGFALAARWMGWTTVGFVDNDAFCQKVLEKNFPGVPIYGDIKNLTVDKILNEKKGESKGSPPTIDIVTGGFP